MRRTFEDLEVGQALPVASRTVTAADVKAYAEAGGDHNPLHLDDAFARGVGFPGIIAHGMFTMGHLSAAVSAWAGDAEAVTMISAQFRAPVFMGDVIEAGGSVKALDPDARTATLELWVRVERDAATEWPIRKGEAHVRLT